MPACTVVNHGCWTTHFVVGLLALTTAACSGGLVGGGSGQPGDKLPPEKPVSVSSVPSAATCASEPVAAARSPIRRLTREQYENSVRDVLGVPVDASTFEGDRTTGRFRTNVTAAVSENQVRNYIEHAETLSVQALDDHQNAWFDCDVSQDSCVEPWARTMARRLYRRPPTAAELDSLMTAYRYGRTEWSAREGLELVLTKLLSSPNFLYIHELPAGDTSAGTLVALDPHQLATRLSMFLWNTTPDDELLSAADSGALVEPDELERQARRLLADTDRASVAIGDFHRQWLRVDFHAEKLANKDRSLFTMWTPSLVEAVTAELGDFTSDLILQRKGTWQDLLTADYSLATPEVAALYGAGHSGSGVEEIALDPQQRAGVLTMPAVLGANSHSQDTSVVERGLLIRRNLLCEELGERPENLDIDPTMLKDPNRLVDPQCSYCHKNIDPIGDGFEQYDAVGQFNGAASGNGEILPGVNSQLVAGQFDDVVDLAQKLADAEEAQLCATTMWLEYARTLVPTTADGCSIRSAFERFKNSGYVIEELIVGIVLSDSFVNVTVGG